MYTIMVALLNGSEHLRPVVVLQAVCRALLSSSLESQNMRFNTLNTLLRASNLSFWATKSVSFWDTKSVSFCKIGTQILDPPPTPPCLRMLTPGSHKILRPVAPCHAAHKWTTNLIPPPCLITANSEIGECVRLAHYQPISPP